MTPADYRAARGLSIQQAARRVGISRRYLAQIERHGARSFDLAERLAAAYQAPISVFMRR